ncbi:hypothetical protein [Streptomyces scopuliridis]|uniref:Uncharacterized protein n=1 Tax=Streptomyces scopuliridis RB72 TaxID=1440053 RepID=A0A2T7TDP6_9ACTN|nr:hypothetical protein [Streptomyces scopuliridis]PVE13211.1 hypothetical protein Y717_20930 [Streptomyces scopuliridis RB72]
MWRAGGTEDGIYSVRAASYPRGTILEPAWLGEMLTDYWAKKD